MARSSETGIEVAPSPIGHQQPTAQELRVLAGLAWWGTARETAERLGVGYSSVDRCVDNLRRKAGLRCATQLVAAGY